jgi:hypothetical protein
MMMTTMNRTNPLESPTTREVIANPLNAIKRVFPDPEFVPARGCRGFGEFAKPSTTRNFFREVEEPGLAQSPNLIGSGRFSPTR